MTPRQIRLVRSPFATVTPCADATAHLLYDQAGALQRCLARGDTMATPEDIRPSCFDAVELHRWARRERSRAIGDAMARAWRALAAVVIGAATGLGRRPPKPRLNVDML